MGIDCEAAVFHKGPLPCAPAEAAERVLKVILDDLNGVVTYREETLICVDVDPKVTRIQTGLEGCRRVSIHRIGSRLQDKDLRSQYDFFDVETLSWVQQRMLLMVNFGVEDVLDPDQPFSVRLKEAFGTRVVVFGQVVLDCGGLP